MATRKHKQKFSNTTMLFIVIAIALAFIIISGGFPEAAQFFKPKASGAISPIDCVYAPLKINESVFFASHTTKLINVGSGTTPAVIVSVDGVAGVVSGYAKIDGLGISIVELHYSDIVAERSATLGICRA